ncbi:MAG: hypothetical protein IJE07_06315 [Clostridia bacterium]|nr:hypothetical protein [Clostridia bacterium]
MKNLPVPPHLKPITQLQEASEIHVSLRLCCPCGSLRFMLEQSVFTPEEQAAIDANEAAADAQMRGFIVRPRRNEEGKTVLMRKRWLFGRWEPLDLPEPPPFIDVRVIRATCCACGKQHTLVDSRLHGNLAVYGEIPAEGLQWQPHWQRVAVPEEAAWLTIEVRNESSMEEFLQCLPTAALSDYDNAFEALEIFATDADGQLGELLCEAETY